MSAHSPSYGSETDKTDLEKELGQPHLDEREKNVLEASQPPFAVYDDEAKYEETDAEPKAEAQNSVNNINAVPNGGTTAWLQVLCTFFIYFNTWGYTNTFGIYQTYYEQHLLSHKSPSEISWIGSLGLCFLMLFGAIGGPIYDQGYVHELLGVGSFLIVFGQMMLSLSTEYYQVFLSQAVCIGIGLGLTFVPGPAVLSTYFSTRLSTALGVACAGSSIGAVIYPVVFYRLEPHVGFGWATRVIGFIALATLGVSNLVLRVRVVPSTRRKFFDLDAWKEAQYVFFNIGSWLAFFGLYVPFFYITTYSLNTGIMTPSLAFYSLAVLNGGSFFGRTLPNFLADYVGPFNVVLPSAFFGGILQYGLVGAHSTGSVLAIAALYGFFTGSLVSLTAPIYVRMCGTKKRGLIGTRIGMGLAFVSTGVLVGTPVTGAILDASSFKYIWICGATAQILGSFFIALSRFAHSEGKLWVKV